jgi:hypothetical protein
MQVTAKILLYRLSVLAGDKVLRCIDELHQDATKLDYI